MCVGEKINPFGLLLGWLRSIQKWNKKFWQFFFVILSHYFCHCGLIFWGMTKLMWANFSQISYLTLARITASSRSTSWRHGQYYSALQMLWHLSQKIHCVLQELLFWIIFSLNVKKKVFPISRSWKIEDSSKTVVYRAYFVKMLKK